MSEKKAFHPFIGFAAICLTVFLAVFALCSCSRGSSTQTATGPWNIPTRKGELTARLDDDGNYGYVLSVSGSGEMEDFASAKDAPWYSVSGRISSIALSDEIKRIGNNAFSACTHANAVILPDSVREFGPQSFNGGCKVCVYKSSPLASVEGIYVYSEDSPREAGLFWHIDNNKAVIWDTMRVLFIGNSFTYTFDIDRLFGEIARSAGFLATVERITIGAHTISQFADPSDEGGAEIEKRLTERSDYDIIILQEQSVRPITSYEQFLDGAGKLVKRIKDTQKNCKVYLYATWGYPGQSQVIGQDIPTMERNLREAYAKAGSALGLEVCNVGKAFTEVFTTHGEINLLGPDNKHPSYAGSYLSALVNAYTILGIDPRSCPFDGYPLPSGVKDGTDFSPETSMILKNIAYSTVTGGGK